MSVKRKCADQNVTFLVDLHPDVRHNHVERDHLEEIVNSDIEVDKLSENSMNVYGLP